jgi:2-polyprenyl-6-methoxyphenol hydroxylase-like FAD-dependent oxidoreductase
MRTVVVVGAGMAGLGAALALGRRGYRVILCERDPAPVPTGIEEMWTAWPRPGTPQAHLLHIFQPRFCREMRIHAPDVLDRAREAGALPFNSSARRPGGDPLPEDRELDALYCRRPIMEGLLRQAVEAEPGIEVRAGCSVAGLLAERAGHDGLPRVVGVRTRDGAELRADAVIVAGGRHLPLPAWLKAIGAATPEEVVEGCGGLYFGRNFRVLPTVEDPDGAPPPWMLQDLGYLGVILSPGDNGTFCLVLGPRSTDRELRVLRKEDVFMAAARSMPSLAPWLAPEKSAAIGPVEALGRLNNLLRRFVVAGRPPALGLFVIGDARCHTNPTMGWGAGLGVSQAFALAGVLTEGPADPLAQALAFEDRVAGELEGWHHLIVEQDRAHTRVWQGGQDPPPNSPAEDFEAYVRTVVTPAMADDSTVFRAARRRMTLLDPPDALACNTAVLERAASLAATRRPPATAQARPTREELLAIIAHPM